MTYRNKSALNFSVNVILTNQEEYDGRNMKHEWVRQEINTGFCAKKTPREREHLKNLGIDGRKILKFVLNKAVGVGEDWIYVGQYRENWRVHSNAVIFEDFLTK